MTATAVNPSLEEKLRISLAAARASEIDFDEVGRKIEKDYVMAFSRGEPALMQGHYLTKEGIISYIEGILGKKN